MSPLQCSRHGLAIDINLSQTRNAGEAAPAAYPRAPSRPSCLGSPRQVESGEPFTADRNFRTGVPSPQERVFWTCRSGLPRQRYPRRYQPCRPARVDTPVRGRSADHGGSTASACQATTLRSCRTSALRRLKPQCFHPSRKIALGV